MLLKILSDVKTSTVFVPKGTILTYEMWISILSSDLFKSYDFEFLHSIDVEIETPQVTSNLDRHGIELFGMASKSFTNLDEILNYMIVNSIQDFSIIQLIQHQKEIVNYVQNLYEDEYELIEAIKLVKKEYQLGLKYSKHIVDSVYK